MIQFTEARQPPFDRDAAIGRLMKFHCDLKKILGTYDSLLFACLENGGDVSQIEWLDGWANDLSLALNECGKRMVEETDE